MRKIIYPCLLLGIICLTLEGASWALDDKSDVKKEVSTITLDEAVVSAKREKQSKTASSYVTLGGYEYDVEPADWMRTSDTAVLLTELPGVSLQQNGGVSGFPFLRGLGDDRVRIKVDGMDLISACPNHMNSPLSYIDPSNVDSMSVMAGITPVSMGGDSIAGTIVVNSPVPEFAKAGEGIFLKGSAGGFARSNGGSAGGNISAAAATERFSLRYGGSVVQSGNYKAAEDFKPAGPAAVDKGWLPGDEVGSSRFKAQNHAMAMAWRKEGDLLQLNLGLQYIPYEGWPNQRMDMTYNYSEQANLRYLSQYAWGTLEARIYHEHTRHSMDFAEDKQFYYGNPAIFVAPGMPMETKAYNTGASVKGEVRLSGRDLLRAGIEGQRYRLDDWWPPSPVVLPPPYTVGGMAPWEFISIHNGKRDRLGAFSEWEAKWGPEWLTLLGVRGEMVMMDTGNVHGYNNTPMYNGPPLFPASTFNAHNHRKTDYNADVTALARYTPKPTRSFEMGYSRKTRSPNLYERYAWSVNTMAMEMINFAGDGNFYVGNLDLKPEVAHTVSVTADLHDADRKLWELKLTPHYTYVEDYIDARRCPPGIVCTDTPAVRQSFTATTGFVYLQFVNQSASLYGIDVSGSLVLVKSGRYGDVTTRGLLSYVRGKNETSNDDLYNIMPLNGKVALVHRLGGWMTTMEGQFVAAKRQVSEVRNEIKTPGYSLFNIRSSYTWKGLGLYGGIENVLDKFYSLPLGGAYVGQGATMSGNVIPWGIPVPGPARTFYAGVTVKY